MQKVVSSVVFNGKFTAQPVTGVQRFARELLVEVDRLLAEGRWIANVPIALAVPVSNAGEVPALVRIKLRELPGKRLHFWEQWHLLAASRNSLLVNLTGSAPLFKTGQLCTFHDAAVFDVPGGYSTVFRTWYRLLFKIQSRLSRRLLTVSEFSRLRLSHHLRISPERIGVIPNGADHVERVCAEDEILQKIGVQRGSYLLAVGSDNPSKNFPALIKAFSRVKAVDTKLVVVGGRNKAVFSTSTDTDLPEDGRIVRAGRVTDAELKALYRHARAFIFPSLYEGFGIPPLEAMASGCPVLAAKAASIPEVCGDAVGYFDPLDLDSIQAALERAVSDRGWLENLRRAGHARAGQFTWTRAAEALLSELAALGVVRASVSSTESHYQPAHT